MSTLYLILVSWFMAGIVYRYSDAYHKTDNALHKKAARITIDGNLNKREWEGSKKETNFSFPWSDRKAPATEFFFKVEGKFFNFAFRVEDQDIVLKDFRKETDVARGDRVEIFLAGNRDLKEYFCLEIAPNAKVLDYKASFYRKFDDTWNLPGLLVAAKINQGGYVVEGRVPMEALKSLGIFDTSKKGSCFLMGLYRAEYSTTKTDKPLEEWISWIRPDTDKPDFHVPSSFSSFCIAQE